jgi:hypothetical protein
MGLLRVDERKLHRLVSRAKKVVTFLRNTHCIGDGIKLISQSSSTELEVFRAFAGGGEMTPYAFDCRKDGYSEK